jgi:hypothetical protein
MPYLAAGKFSRRTRQVNYLCRCESMESAFISDRGSCKREGNSCSFANGRRHQPGFSSDRGKRSALVSKDQRPSYGSADVPPRSTRAGLTRRCPNYSDTSRIRLRRRWLGRGLFGTVLCGEWASLAAFLGAIWARVGRPSRSDLRLFWIGAR